MNRTRDADPEPDFHHEDMSGDLAKSFLQGDCLDQEKILEAAGFHLMQEKGLCEYVHKQIEAAIQCSSSEVPHAEREYVIVCGYAQNLPLPHYGGEQPGEIYYFSALTVNLFGIVDLSLSLCLPGIYGKEGKQQCCIPSHEGPTQQVLAQKGASWEEADHLNGQLQWSKQKQCCPAYGPVIGEDALFQDRGVCFYIRGHTKNTCDRIFNQMKLKYHKNDIFSWSEAIHTLKTKKNVCIIDAQESMFMDYGDMLDTFYDKFKGSTIQRNHIFKLEHIDITLSMQCATNDGAPFVPQRMVKWGQVLGQERTTTINTFLLEQLKPPGLRPINQVELFKKFRPFIPQKYWDKTCPEPSEDVLSQVKNETATKRKNKTATTKPKITLTMAATKAPSASETMKKKRTTEAPITAKASGRKRATTARESKQTEQKKGKTRSASAKRASADSNMDSDWSA
jgi:hypothetical protein